MALFASRVLLSAGFLLLGYCTYVLADGWLFQRSAGRWLDGFSSSGPTLEQALGKVRERGVLGRIEVPRLGMSTVVVDNAAPRSLLRSAGHLDDTALPGFDGNVAIAGHRGTHFRPLRHVRIGDHITITTPYGEFGYTVHATRVVDPEDVGVLRANGRDSMLTLITCFPFDYVGPAPKRFVVHAFEEARRYVPSG